MVRKLSSVLWGIALIAVGVVIALNATGITSIDLFFDGWWTLFIIIPCVVGFFTEGDKLGNLIGLAVGVVLLLAAQGIFQWKDIWEFGLAAIIILIGIKLVGGGLFHRKPREVQRRLEESGKTQHTSFTAFTGNRVNLDGQCFYGAELNAVFGAIDYDLRNALIPEDCVIKASAVFGGINILLPQDVHVKISSNSVFGSVDNKRNSVHGENAVTIYIEGSGIFGGVDIK